MARGRLSRSRRMAPRTARSASRLWGGILAPRSSVSVATEELLLAEDRYLELRRDAGVEPDGYRVLPECLDRLVERDAPALDLDPGPAEEIGDVLGRDGPEELALLGRLAPLLVGEPLDALAHALRIGLDARRLGLLLALDVLQVAQVARGGGDRELLRDEVVARVAVGDVLDLAPASDLRDVVEQDDLHELTRRRTAAARPCAPA